MRALEICRGLSLDVVISRGSTILCIPHGQGVMIVEKMWSCEGMCVGQASV